MTSSASDPAAAVDAFLLLSFGGPQAPDEVMPFLRNVTGGRGIPDERLAEVAQHYLHYGGVSPITAQNEALLAAIALEFERRGITVPVYFGNRNWRPYLTDTARQMHTDGVRHALVLATSATGSYSGCRQYREDLARTTDELAGAAPRFTKLRHYFDHPGFIAANAAAVRKALTELGELVEAGEPAGSPGPSGATAGEARLVFTAHSVPNRMNEQSGPQGGLYLAEHRVTARLVAETVRGPGAEFDLVWQSRSGPPSVPWLGPDVNEHLRTLAQQGVQRVVVAPTGFISDHMEVIWDLDNEAAETAAELGLQFVRAGTAGTHPSFVAAIADLVAEQLTGANAEHLGELGLCGVDCPAFCCPAPPRRP
ncbi:MAG: putative ferrochelatase [Frankiales bacterium]|nr:putative ferrochelatase [Frankiales bacterium]